MQERDEKMICPKCGFKPSTFTSSKSDKWKLEYKDSCYTKNCGWDDVTHKEHLHQICPDCEYTFGVPCSDYEGVEAWDTGETATATTAVGVRSTTPVSVPIHIKPGTTPATQPRVLGGGRLQQSNTAAATNRTSYRAPVFSDPWETDCPNCPVTAAKLKETEEAEEVVES